MDCLAVTLVFEPLAWVVGLSIVAGLVLLIEGLALIAPTGRVGGGSWGVLAISAGAGILLGWIWGSWLGDLAPLTHLLYGPLAWSSRLALLATTVMLTTAGSLAAVSVTRGLLRALAGAEGVSAFAALLLRGIGLLVLAGATAFWVPGGAVGAIGVSAAIWAVRSYGRTTSPVRRPLKALLLGLRILIVWLLTVWSIRPALEYRHKQEVKSVVLFCADTSSSMQRRDAIGWLPSPGTAGGALPPSRIRAVVESLKSHRTELSDLAERADLDLVGLSSEASGADSFAEGEGWDFAAIDHADGSATALGDSLTQALERYGDQQRKVAATILLSDGCNNTADVIAPERLAELLATRGVPVYTVGAGSDRISESTRALTVRDLSVPEEIEAFNRLPITAIIDAVGLQTHRLKVTCTFGDREVGAQTLAVNDAQSAIPVRFDHIPLSAGFHRAKIEAEVVGQAPEELAGRPDAGKLVHVVDREMRVLYVEGKFRYEAKYIARALIAAERFTIDRRVLLQPLGDRHPTPLSEDIDDWLAYHAIIFGDVAASHFTRKQLEIVRDLVREYGKGFCMLGGSDSFGRGGWADTPIADVLPVDLNASRGQVDAPIKVVPTADGLQSDLMRISETGSDTRDAWEKLDLLPGANKLGPAKPAASVLARTPQGAALLVTQPYGKGRSAAIAFDTTWRWVLTKEDTADLQRRFWRQAALFLSAPKGTVWVVTDKTNYDLIKLRRRSESIRISAGVEDSRGRPLLDTRVRVRLIDPEGKEITVAVHTAGKIREGQLPPPTRPGLYTLKIDARAGGRPLAAEHQFEVRHRDLESLEALANHGLLRRMSALSGGTFAPLSELGDLLKRLRVAAKPQQRDVVRHVKLSDHLRWPVVAAILLLLCLEWAIRKRRGLV